MARLFTFEEEAFPSVSRSKVKSAQACLLYYLFHGRNAWHSTWVSQYSNGCMHTTLESAKATAERQRTQGSVFYIEELAAVAFLSARGAVIATQINTPSPLRGYSPHAVGAHAAGTVRVKGSRDCYFEKGAPMLGAALSFNSDSRFWKERPPSRNSVTVVASKDPRIDLKPLPKSKLVSRRSTSYGRDYLLSWREIVSRHDEISPKYARRAAKAFVIEAPKAS